ncbi:hypothetical protein LXA43DRAFT_1034827 [Ganoderma leucocontextum]|nr:hypothetical protein LXA43DRAFT_1034827 [Ganoderma leucocontextum]
MSEYIYAWCFPNSDVHRFGHPPLIDPLVAFFHMSQTLGDQRPAPSATFDEDLFHTSVLQVQQDFAILGLLGGLYGVLTILSMLSIWALTRRGSTRKQRPTTIVLCLTILALFTSTTVYVVTCILSCQFVFLKAFISSGYALWSYNGIDIKFPDGPSKLVKDYSRIHSCASTAAITINITLGDAIVCWRASVVWYQNRIVKAVFSVLLLATFVLGVADTAWGCRSPYRVMPFNFYSFVPLGTSFEGLPIGIAACVLSLGTNLLATLLVGCKAWESRRRLRGYLAAQRRGSGSQVQKLLALLIESGAVYCAIWGVVVAFQIGEYHVGDPESTPVADGFLSVFNVVVSGAIVPLIAIYPAFIIVLVALDRSHMEKGLTQDHWSVPTPHISRVTIDTMTARPHESGSRSRSHWGSGSEVLAIDGRDKVEHGDGPDDSRDACGRTSEKQKASEEIV